MHVSFVRGKHCQDAALAVDCNLESLLMELNHILKYLVTS